MKANAIYIIIFLLAGCAVRETVTYKLWDEGDDNRHASISVSGLNVDQINTIIEKNPGCAPVYDSSGKVLYISLKSNEVHIENGLAVKTLATPFTVVIDGVQLVVVGAALVAVEAGPKIALDAALK